jgi:hypothetical protein
MNVVSGFSPDRDVRLKAGTTTMTRFIRLLGVGMWDLGSFAKWP